MREILFRGKRKDNGEWVYGCLVHGVFFKAKDNSDIPYIFNINDVDYDSFEDFDECQGYYEIYPETLSQYTGLKDKNGKKIFEGDVLRFEDYHGIWQSSVVFERGVFGLDVCKVKQIQNPKDWKEKHDKVKSRYWACEWGYEEFGTAFTYRKPISQKSVFRGNPEEYRNSELYDLCEKYGHGNYYVLAEIIGNIHDNPELLEVKA